MRAGGGGLIGDAFGASFVEPGSADLGGASVSSIELLNCSGTRMRVEVAAPVDVHVRVWAFESS